MAPFRGLHPPLLERGVGGDLVFLNGVEVVLFSSDGGMCLSSLYPDPLFTSRNGG